MEKPYSRWMVGGSRAAVGISAAAFAFYAVAFVHENNAAYAFCERHVIENDGVVSGDEVQTSEKFKLASPLLLDASAIGPFHCVAEHKDALAGTDAPIARPSFDPWFS